MHGSNLPPDAAEQDPFEPPSTIAPLSTMRRMIGARLLESKLTAPHFYLSVDVEVDSILALRADLLVRGSQEPPTVNDCVVAAAARALREVPGLNARVDGSRLRLYEHANIGVAVAMQSGLVVPVLRDADRKDLPTISREIRALAVRARANKLTPDDYRGGTFTVSNLGMYGVREFIAILNPPQAGILALGRASPRAIVRDGRVCVATVMTASLSADHRVVDGAAGASFLQAVQRQLQDPSGLLGPPGPDLARAAPADDHAVEDR
jgi:pyruvate dehydrogenase E2 component (dihydrolipoamide acetyltransferase)